MPTVSIPKISPARFRCACLAAVALFAGACERQGEVLATALVIQGDVRHGTEMLRPGATFRPSATVVSGAGAFAVFSPLPGTMLCLDSSAELQLFPAQLRKKDDLVVGRVIRAELKRGRLILRISPAAEGPLDLRILVPGGEVRVFEEAVAEIDASDPSNTRVLCASGRVTASGGIELISGAYTVHGNSGFSFPREASDDAQVWPVVLELRRLDAQLEDVTERQRSLRPTAARTEKAESAKK